MSPAAPTKRRSIQQMRTQVVDQVLDQELDELSGSKRLLQSSLKIGVMVARDFFQHLVKLQAMALAFKTLLSLAPLLAVVFSLLKGFGVHNRMEPALAEALEPLGDKGREITANLIGFVDKMSASALGSVGLIALFITVLSLMSTIEEAFNHIWRVKSRRKLARQFSDYLSAILVGPVLVFAAVTITATLQHNAFVSSLVELQTFGKVVLALLRLVPYLTLWGAFSFVYIFIPNTQVKIRSALVGGLVAALLWQTVGWGFARFVATSTQYYAIYSSFAILLLFLLWVQIGWVIVLLGAQVAYAHQHIHFFQGDRLLLAQSPAGREKLALHTMLLIGRNFYYGIDPKSVTDLAADMQIPAGLVKEFLEMFADTRLVLPIVDGETYVLGRDPETIFIKEILDCVRHSGKKLKIAADRSDAETEINTLLRDVDDAMTKSLAGKSLQAVILSLPVPDADA
ncbi:MAG: YihY/virulence factor BrkB family protein [Deltaproteobacteria bacterium]|nr:YihY/virulence factor BrkB family protein [Deltaproteobacteria bacterium]